MRPYFFDIVADGTVEHDFHGHRLHKQEEAHEMAELIALDIECTGVDRKATEVVVRDINGTILFSVRVRPHLAAA
jgi:hypothetical protein